MLPVLVARDAVVMMAVAVTERAWSTDNMSRQGALRGTCIAIDVRWDNLSLCVGVCRTILGHVLPLLL